MKSIQNVKEISWSIAFSEYSDSIETDVIGTGCGVQTEFRWLSIEFFDKMKFLEQYINCELLGKFSVPGSHFVIYLRLNINVKRVTIEMRASATCMAEDTCKKY
jgi:hypothetical protein